MIKSFRAVAPSRVTELDVLNAAKHRARRQVIVTAIKREDGDPREIN